MRLFDRRLGLQKQADGWRRRSNVIRTHLSHSKTFSGQEREPCLDDQDNSLLLEEARDLKEKLQAIEKEDKSLDEQIDRLATELPNLTSDGTPRGNNANATGYINENLREGITSSDPLERSHVRLGAEYDLLDFSNAATISGWGWYYSKNEADMLEDALVQYAKYIAMKHGFSRVSPPSMVYSHIVGACGFQPRDQGGEQQVYSIQQSKSDIVKDTPSHSLAGTAEIPFAGMHANKILESTDLPLRVVGSSRCYRAEAGARGVKTKGLYRVHEFTKVEMFAWTAPGAELDMFNAMIEVQKEVLQSLGLYCRILEMPSTDLGASAFRKVDIEAYFPSRAEVDGGWGEVTSTSICTDYQTRRLNTRVRGSDNKITFPSTVNGTAVAVPRILAALLEYGWSKEEDCIKIPEVLWSWMHGVQNIKKHR